MNKELIMNYSSKFVPKQVSHLIELVDITEPTKISNGTELALLDYILIMLYRGNPLLFISDEIDKSIEYSVNLLSLLESSDNLLKIVKTRWQRTNSDVSEREMGKLISTYFEKLSNKIILSLDIEKLTQDSMNDPQLWNRLIEQISKTSKQYIFFVSDMKEFYNFLKPDEKYHVFDIFWSTGSSLSQFVIPLNWLQYYQFIENGNMPFRFRKAVPILLSPRPKEIPKYHIEEFQPDSRFRFP